MSPLGYIVSSKKLRNIKSYIKVVNDISLVEDTSKPILIVGLDNAKSYSKDFSILKKKLSENVYWTFDKTEKRDIFEKDIDYFHKHVIFNIIKILNYYYINIIKLNYTGIKKIYNIIFSSNKKYIYINKDMVYILYNSSNILGISLNILEYCGIRKQKVLDKIMSCKSNVLCNDKLKNIPLFNDIGNKKYAIPYFISIE